MQSPMVAQYPSHSSHPTSKQQQLAPKLPIGSRGEGDSDHMAPPSKAPLGGIATPSRRRNQGLACTPAASPTQALLSSEASGGASYREQLRASGNRALLQVREGARSCRASPAATPVALADKISGPSFGAAPTPSTATPAGFGCSPLATMGQQVPLVFVHAVGGDPYASQQAGCPNPFAFVDMPAMSPMAGAQCPNGQSGMAAMTSFHFPSSWGTSMAPSEPGMAAMTSSHCPGSCGTAMAASEDLAMPHMIGHGQALSGEQLAAQLRAAAPDVYED